MKRLICMLAASFALAACGGGDDARTAPAAPEAEVKEAPEAAPVAEEKAEPKHAAFFAPLPAEAVSDANPITEAKVALGRQLYYDTRLSKNHDLSCNSCHQLDKFGQDGEPTSPGHKGQRGGRNSPTVFNAALHLSQFWDGRAADVEEQAKGPILNPIEMGMPGEDHVLTVVNSIPQYVDAFKEAFPGDEPAVTYDNLAKAIGAFERKLLTPSPFDAYLQGDADALTAEQLRGLDTFVEVGCTACHAGVTVGGGMYQKLGLVEAWPNQDDKGRSDVTGNEAEAMFFKVPSLRNVTKTGPYFHDGSVAELTEAVRMMGKHQLGKELSDEQVGDIVAFLGALEGTIEEEYVAMPELPPSTDDTPKPDPS